MKLAYLLTLLIFFSIFTTKVYANEYQAFSADLAQMAKTYEVERKNPAAFFKKHIKDQELVKELTDLAKKYGVKELAPASFGNNSITLGSSGKKVEIKILDIELSKVSLNGFELQIDYSSSIEEQFKYIGRVLRRTGYQSHYLNLLFSRAYASEEVESVSVLAIWAWARGYSTSNNILSIRDKLAKSFGRNIFVDLKCEPQKITMRDSNNYYEHIVENIYRSQNPNQTNEYSGILENASRLGLIQSNRKRLTVNAKSEYIVGRGSQNLERSYSLVASGTNHDGKYRINEDTIEIENNMVSYENSRLSNDDYLRLASLMNTCCKDRDCIENVNQSKAGMQRHPNPEGSR